MIRQTSFSRLAGIALASSLAFGPALAQPTPSAAASPSAAGARSDDADSPGVQHQNGIAYVTGGIASSGQDRVKQLGRDMNLQLTFAKAAGGDYVAQVGVTIAAQGGGKVLDVPSSDPLLFVQLKPGRYVVTATAEGKSIERVVDVPAKGRHSETLTW